MGNLNGGLSREKVKEDILNSSDFGALPPEVQHVFTEYVEGKGPIITALNQMKPIVTQCGGVRLESLDFYK